MDTQKIAIAIENELGSEVLAIEISDSIITFQADDGKRYSARLTPSGKQLKKNSIRLINY